MELRTGPVAIIGQGEERKGFTERLEETLHCLEFCTFRGDGVKDLEEEEKQKAGSSTHIGETKAKRLLQVSRCVMLMMATEMLKGERLNRDAVNWM